MSLYSRIFNLVFARMDAEMAHQVGFALIKLASFTPAGPVLRTFTALSAAAPVKAMGLEFPSAFGLAAGFDKAGNGVAALTNLGFGHIEIGTVTAQGQPGNPKPRLFRLIQDKAVLNRMGFNNPGAKQVATNVAKQHKRLSKQYKNSTQRPIIGINIGKTKKVNLEDAIADYVASAGALAPVADYLVVNVSSPNTPGLRLLQNVRTLRPLLHQVRSQANRSAGREVPLLVKIAPDLSDQDILDVAELVQQMGLAGVVATNTTIGREALLTDPHEVTALGVGGVSGAPLKQRSLQVLKQLRTALGPEPVIISVGGVTTAEDVQDRLELGATLVQGYTAFLYQGPMWARAINRGVRSQPAQR